MKRLENFLINTYNNNPYYQNLVQKYGIHDISNISAYPILSRDTLQKNRFMLFSEGYQEQYFAQMLYRQFSSGTSGIPVNVYWDYNDYYRSILPLWRKRMQYYDILPTQKRVEFTLRVFDKNDSGKITYALRESDRVLLINRSSIQTEENYFELLKLIECHNPVWLYIQPFILSKLIYYYKKFQMSPCKSIRYIESVGEVLSPKLQSMAVTFFQCPVANMYGSEEMNCIAYECPNHNMHILTDNVYVECKHNGIITSFGEGSAIITNLNNKAMPLIRYEQGDIIVVNKINSCPCGDCSPIVAGIKGRILNSIRCNNIEINSYLLLEIIDEVNNQFNDAIVNFRFIYYSSKKELLCHIQIDNTNDMWKQEIVQAVEQTYRKKLCKQADIDFIVKENFVENVTSNKFSILEIEE